MLMEAKKVRMVEEEQDGDEDGEDGTSADDQERGVLIEMVMRSRVVLKTMG